MRAYVEIGVAMAYDRGSAAWTFDLRHWGECGQGRDEAAALADLSARTAEEPVVAERIHGDERTFRRDRDPATDAERLATVAVLTDVRALTIAYLESCPDDLLDAQDPDRVLPGFARWRTLREMAWHVADTESRYYLPMAGLAGRARGHDLIEELRLSHRHVIDAISAMPADLDVITDGTEWTATKLLRRLAWHERGELDAMRALAERLSGG